MEVEQGLRESLPKIIKVKGITLTKEEIIFAGKPLSDTQGNPRYVWRSGDGRYLFQPPVEPIDNPKTYLVQTPVSRQLVYGGGAFKHNKTLVIEKSNPGKGRSRFTLREMDLDNSRS